MVQKSLCLRVPGFVGTLRAYHRKGSSTPPHPLTVSFFLELASDACRQVAESIPLTLQQLQMSNAFAAVSVLSWAPGIPDLILAVLFAWQNDISAAIDVGLAAALTVTM